jgi:hypothetical protein
VRTSIGFALKIFHLEIEYEKSFISARLYAHDLFDGRMQHQWA